MTTFEEAKRCPKCKQPGREVDTQRGSYGSTMHVIHCANKRCQWYETPYIVQVNSDGSIPEPSNDRPHQFPKLVGQDNLTEADIERRIQSMYTQTRPDLRGE